MEAKITTHNFRTGYHVHYAGEAWEVRDGLDHRGWQTVVPLRKDERLVMGASRYIGRDDAHDIARIVREAQDISSLREILEDLYPHALRRLTAAEARQVAEARGASR